MSGEDPRTFEQQLRELEAANRRLRDALRFKDQAIAVLAHDVRGPLNIISGHAKLLCEAGLDKQEEASVQAILRQSKKLLDLSQGLLDETKGEASRARLDPAELDLAEACREIAAEHEILGAERGVSLEVQAPPELPLLADRLKVRQILHALVGQALSRAREGGNVRVELCTQGPADAALARVSIVDDGAPPGADELPGLFERFRGIRGNVALAACRDMVELHGGEIWAEPEAEGCAFRFTLPATAARLPGRPLSPPGERPRVLLVEDETDLAAIAAEMLAAHYRVEHARDGAEAIAKAHELRPDVVVMDVFLPRLDGLDATAALKAAPDTKDIPVILVSAHQGLADKVRALNLGAVDYLAKPFDAATLTARVQAALEAGAAAREPGREALLCTDAATGLLDRDSFLRRTAQEASRARRYGRPMAVVGLSPGAVVERARLGKAAAALRGVSRAGDLLCHLGDGRFASCLPDAGLPAAASVAARLAQALSRELGLEVKVGVVDGLAGSSQEQLESALRQSGAT